MTYTKVLDMSSLKQHACGVYMSQNTGASQVVSGNKNQQVAAAETIATKHNFDRQVQSCGIPAAVLQLQSRVEQLGASQGAPCKEQLPFGLSDRRSAGSNECQMA